MAIEQNQGHDELLVMVLAPPCPSSGSSASRRAKLVGAAATAPATTLGLRPHRRSRGSVGVQVLNRSKPTAVSRVTHIGRLIAAKDHPRNERVLP